MKEYLLKRMEYKAIVIGASAGGLNVLSKILKKLPLDFSLPVIIAQHRSKDERELLEEVLQSKCKIKVKQADEKEKIENGIVYCAPPNYHLLIERNCTFSLSGDMLVNYSRPSIEVLFETAASVYKNKLVGIILTGANNDGSKGIKVIKEYGGMTIAQNPQTTEYPSMPQAAVDTGCVDFVWEIEQITDFLLRIGRVEID